MSFSLASGKSRILLAVPISLRAISGKCAFQFGTETPRPLVQHRFFHQNHSEQAPSRGIKVAIGPFERGNVFQAIRLGRKENVKNEEAHEFEEAQTRRRVESSSS